nr:MAG TPA: thioredoxin [Caudoviricetes sp.]
MRKLEMFHACWCKPCNFLLKNIIPVVQEQCPDQVELVDVDKKPSYAERRGVTRLPTIYLQEDDVAVYRLTMPLEPEKLIAWLRGESDDPN